MTGPVTDPEEVGQRIEQLLEASAAAGPVARERAEELVRVVVDLYGAGLERLLEIAHDTGRLDDVLLDALAADELVASLLIVHGLHPESVVARIQRALADVRPRLAARGAEVHLVAVSPEGGVRLRLAGAGGGCGSSPAALGREVEEAILVRAPEVVQVVVEPEPVSSGLIPVSSLTSRLHAAPA